MATYLETLAAAEKVVIESAESEEKGKEIWSKFVGKLRKKGGTTVTTLAKAKWETLQECGLPELVAQAVAEVFRADGPSKPGGLTTVKSAVIITANQAKRATIEALVQGYDPDDSNDIIPAELTRRLGGNKACIVFNKTGQVNVDATVLLVKEIVTDKLEPRASFVLEGIPVPVYRIGENPMRMYDEDPLFKGKRLRADGTSDQVPFSWQGIQLPIRQLARLAVETREAGSAQETVDLVEKFKDDITALRRRWPNASIKFTELESTSQLPTLKIRMGNGTVSSQPAERMGAQSTGRKDPFGIEGGNRQY